MKTSCEETDRRPNHLRTVSLTGFSELEGSRKNYRETNTRASCLLQGKFIRINFDVTGYIVGANIETCILPNESWFQSVTVLLSFSCFSCVSP